MRRACSASRAGIADRRTRETVRRSPSAPRHGRRRACARGGVHDVGVRRAAELGGEIVRAEGEREHVRRTRRSTRSARRRAPIRSARSAAGRRPRRLTRAQSRASPTFGTTTAPARRAPASIARSCAAVGRLGRVDAHGDRSQDRRARRGTRAPARARTPCGPARPASSRSRIAPVAPERERFAEPLGTVGGDEEQERRVERHPGSFAPAIRTSWACSSGARSPSARPSRPSPRSPTACSDRRRHPPPRPRRRCRT